MFPRGASKIARLRLKLARCTPGTGAIRRKGGGTIQGKAHCTSRAHRLARAAIFSGRVLPLSAHLALAISRCRARFHFALAQWTRAPDGALLVALAALESVRSTALAFAIGAGRGRCAHVVAREARRTHSLASAGVIGTGIRGYSVTGDADVVRCRRSRLAQALPSWARLPVGASVVAAAVLKCAK